MIGDIYAVRCNFAMPHSAGGFTLYFREKVAMTGAGFATEEIANAFILTHGANLLDVLSADYKFVSVTVRKLFDDTEPKFQAFVAIGAGGQAGPGLPANNAIVMSIAQGTHPAKSNGRIYIPGIPEAESSVGVVFNTQATRYDTFAQALLNDLPEGTPELGLWEMGVISRKVLTTPDGPPDWAGSFGLATAVSASPIIQTQRRRGTRVRGAFN